MMGRLPVRKLLSLWEGWSLHAHNTEGCHKGRLYSRSHDVRGNAHLPFYFFQENVFGKDIGKKLIVTDLGVQNYF